MKLKSRWKLTQLGPTCSKIGSGATPRGGDQVYKEEGVALIRSQNVYNGRFASEGLAHIKDDHAEQLQGVTVEQGDILLNITGDSVARCCQVPEDVLPARVNQHVSIIRPKSIDWNTRFLMYYLISPHMQSYMLSLAGSGGTRKALTKEMIQQFRIPRPEKFEQERISSLLSAYDDLIENNLRQIKLLEESARLLYEEWFVFLHFPGHKHTRIFKGVPKGWEKKKLGDICAEVKEIVLPRNVEPETPYIGLEHMPRNSITLSTWGKAEEVTSAKHRFVAGDILFGKIRPYFHKVGIALVDGVASSDAIVIRANSDELYSLIVLTLSSKRFVAQVSQKMKEGSKMPRADWKQMQQYNVGVPSSGLIKELNSFVEPLTKQLRSLAVQNIKLNQARDILLPKLMSGEVLS